MEIGITNHVRFLVGGAKKNYDYEIQRGWDRFNSLEALDRQQLARIQSYVPYGGIKVALLRPSKDEPMGGGVYVTVGPMLNSVNYATAASGTTISKGNGLMINVGFFVGGALKKIR